MLGQLEEAMEQYTKALHVYEDIAGKRSTSYAAALCNLGVLYKDMAERGATGSRSGSGSGTRTSAMEREQLLQRADEALQDALSIREECHGTVLRRSLVWLWCCGRVVLHMRN